MRLLLEHIRSKTEEFSRLPVFAFMADQSIDPAQRLSLAPCMAHYVMTFADMNAHVFREEPTQDKYQKLVNVHTYEDASHWPWFVADLKRLGLDRHFRFSETLEFLWGEETLKSRLLAYEMCRLTLQATPLQKLVIVECVEATGNVFLGVASRIGRELEQSTGTQYIYYGPHHFGCESGHTMGTEDVEQQLESIQLSEEERTTSLSLVDKVFALYTSFVGELLAYAKAHPIDQLRNGPLGAGRHDRPAPIPRADVA
jgi:hypothetical protein